MRHIAANAIKAVFSYPIGFIGVKLLGVGRKNSDNIAPDDDLARKYYGYFSRNRKPKV